MGLERFDGKKVLLVGGNESIGVPCAVRGRNKQGFLEIVRDNLINEGIDIETINFFSMMINKNWHISEILRHNLSVEEIKKIQQVSINQLRNDLFGKMYFSKDLADLYKVKLGDKNKRITDMIKEYEKVVTVYQSGANNLMYEMQSSPIEAVVNKQSRQRALNKMKDNKVIDKVGHGMIRNIQDLLSINNDMEIYMLSLYVPKLFDILSHNNDEFKLMIDFINRFNYQVENIAYEYGAKYVDITPIGKYCAKGGVDFHCTNKGNILLASIVRDEIKHGTENNGLSYMNRYLLAGDGFIQDNTGLDGLEEDAYSRICVYKEALEFDDYRTTILRNFSSSEQQNLCKTLISEHENEFAIYDKAKKLCY